MDKKVLVPVAQGIEEMEAITIIDVLRRAGAHVVVFPDGDTLADVMAGLALCHREDTESRGPAS